MGVRVRGATLTLALTLALVAHCLPSLTAWPRSRGDLGEI